MSDSNTCDLHTTPALWKQRLECLLSEINHKVDDLIYKEQENQLWKGEMESSVHSIQANMCSQRVTVSISCQTDEQLEQISDTSPDCIPRNAVTDPSNCFELNAEDDNEHCREAKDADFESVRVASLAVVENESSPSAVADTQPVEHVEDGCIFRSERIEPYQSTHRDTDCSRKDAFTRHINEEKSKLECSQCQKSFETSGKLYYHTLSHREKKYLCTQCDKAFHGQYHLNRHMLSHTGEKAYCCTFCSRRFATQSDCNRHVRKCHSQ